MFFVVAAGVSYAQNNDIDIKYLHSGEGKKWHVMKRPDGYHVPTTMEDDFFIFYTNGLFKHDQSGTTTPDIANARTKNWVYNTTNNIVTWEYVLPGGTTKKMEAEITYIDQERAVVNLSENSKEPNIVVLITE